MPLTPWSQRSAVVFALACQACGSNFAASDDTTDATADAPALGEATGSFEGSTSNAEGGSAGTNAADANASSDVAHDGAHDAAPARDAAGDLGTVDALDAMVDASPMCDPTSPFNAPMLVHGGVNSPDDDLAPRLSPDELNMYFARRPANDLTAPVHIYVATRPNIASPFDAPVALGINSASNDTDPMITDDGLTLFFSSDRPNGSGEFDLYWSQRSSTSVPFTSASPVPTVNSPGSEGHPFLTSDGELWFAYRKAGFDSALHLRRAPRAGTGFGAPVAVTELDSSTDDMWPVLTTDKLTIYFSSLRVGIVPQDKANVWASHRSSPTAMFDAPDSLIEVNSPATDLGGWISHDNCRLYMTSNRGISRGYEIYVASR